jgi:magnesium-transporting ATPase (P-type)
MRMYGEECPAREILKTLGITGVPFLLMVLAFVITLWAIAFGLVWCLGALFYSPPSVIWQNLAMYGTLVLGFLLRLTLSDLFQENIRAAHRSRYSAVSAGKRNAGAKCSAS